MSTSPSFPQRTDIVGRLHAAGCVFAEDEARLLLAAAGSPSQLNALIDRRVAGIPLEHLLGWAEFGSLRVAVDPGVFVPRRRTEFLAHQAIALAQPGAVVVDMCCGSGAIAAAVLAAVPGVEVSAVDIDPAAVRCARRNLPGAHVYQGDLYAALPATLRGRVDVLVANAPYVPTGSIALMPAEARDHEPRSALDGGPDGLDVLRAVAAGARDWLAADGHVLVETGEHQAARVVEHLASYGLAASIMNADEFPATVVIGLISGR